MASKRRTTKKRLELISTVVFITVVVIIAVIYYLFVPKAVDNKPVNTPQTIEGGALTGDFSVHFVDVGQGDGIIIVFPDGKTMLVDAGKYKKDSNLITYIDDLGITVFDYVIATHTDEDHIGEMPTVFEKYQVNYVFRPHVYCSNDKAKGLSEGLNDVVGGKKCGTETYYKFLKAIDEEENCQWSYFNKDSDLTFTFTADGVDYSCSFDFLTPTADVDNISYSDPNDYSPIILVDYCGYKIMLTGDAEAITEKELLDYYSGDLDKMDVDVLKVGHHGAETSSTPNFLAAVKAENFVISCGVGNTYNHPRYDTMVKLLEYGTVYRTDVQGSIVLSVSNSGEGTFKTEKTDYNENDLYITPDMPSK